MTTLHDSSEIFFLVIEMHPGSNDQTRHNEVAKQSRHQKIDAGTLPT